MRVMWAIGCCAALGCSRAAVESPDDAPTTIAPAAEARHEPQAAKKIQQFSGRGVMRIADRANSPTLDLELARTDGERQQGLMFRQTMRDDHGMLFFMPYDNDWVFYMRNTYIRLDMVFIDSAWRVVGVVENTAPLTEDHRSVGAESRYVLELTAHNASKLGIHAGTQLIYEPRPDAPATVP